jgi:uncharacterized protein YrzB (UPF0473 family)
MTMDKNSITDDHILSDGPLEHDPSIMTLQAEDGRNVDFEFLDLIQYGGESYVVLLPVDEGEGEGSGKVVILRIDVSDDSEEESYVRVDSDHTLHAVFGIFREKFRGKFHFTDED